MRTDDPAAVVIPKSATSLEAGAECHLPQMALLGHPYVIILLDTRRLKEDSRATYPT